jgi:thiamine transport system ATP-binding protein
VPSSEGLVVEGLDAEYEGRPVLREISFTVGSAERVALLGPNGSGKTTLLRVLAGLEPAKSGSLRLDGRLLDRVPTHRRGIGFLFQEPSLFPGRSVAQNISYGLEIARWSAADTRRRVDELAARLRIPDLLDRTAESLSGGERQRVALARTLAPKPKLVLLDEPFASVDPEFRATLREEFSETLRAEGVAAIHVTHDAEEGMLIGERLLLLRDGRLVQQGVPGEVFRAPADEEAARFLGYQFYGVGAERFAFHVRSLEEVEEGAAPLEGEVVSVRDVPGEVRVLVGLAQGGSVEWRPPAGRARPTPGERVRLRARWRCRFQDPGGSPGREARSPSQR